MINLLVACVMFHQNIVWKEIDATELALYKDHNYIGNYRIIDDAFFYRLSNGPKKWSDRSEPPYPPPIRNFGIDRTKLVENESRYSINGHPATRDRAIEALTKDGLLDDSNKLRFTIIGEEKDRKKVLEDLNKDTELAKYKSWFLIQHYPKNHRLIKDGFYQEGNPSIYLTWYDGTVLWRQTDSSSYVGMLAALRKVDPNYDPKKDPGPWSKPDIAGIFSKIPPWAFVVIPILLFVLFKDDKQKPNT